MDSVTVKRLRTKAVFKIVFIGLFFSFVPFITFLGLLASQGWVNMFWGQSQLTGLTAVVAGPFYGLLFTVIFGLFVGTFSSLGLMLYAKRKPLVIEIYKMESE